MTIKESVFAGDEPEDTNIITETQIIQSAWRPTEDPLLGEAEMKDSFEINPLDCIFHHRFWRSVNGAGAASQPMGRYSNEAINGDDGNGLRITDSEGFTHVYTYEPERRRRRR